MTAAGLILIDYPAIHEPAVKGYAQFWHSMEYNGISLKDNVRLAALEGIERESTENDFYNSIGKLRCPIAIFVGRNKESERPSNLSERDIERYKDANSNLEIVDFHASGHMILDEEFEKASVEVRRFLDKTL